MAKLAINGYDATFNAFIKFAQRNVNAGDEKAIANAKVQKPLGGRKLVAVTNSLTAEVHKRLRTKKEYKTNDDTRKLFKTAIVNMFGGESKIPESVKKSRPTRTPRDSSSLKASARRSSPVSSGTSKKVIALDAKGRLTAENVIKLCVPGMVKAKATGNWDRKAVQDFIESISEEINLDVDEGVDMREAIPSSFVANVESFVRDNPKLFPVLSKYYIG